MSTIKTPFDLYKHLPRTNCGDCGHPSCLAFAAAVISEERRIFACPHLDGAAARELEAKIERQVNLESIREDQLKELRKEIAALDLCGRAEHIGARCVRGELIVTCLGKDFAVDQQGKVASQCHTHSWFSLPLLDYILHCEGVDDSGRWVPLRELPGGRKWGALFEQRCEKPMRTIADGYSDLFGDLVTMFGGAPAPPAFDSDVAVVLHPFPKVPLLICYWRPDGEMASKLHVFFDETAERNLPMASLFTLGTGISRMLEKIMHRHTGGRSLLD